MPKAYSADIRPFTSWQGDHAGIRVPDMNAAITWYTEKLDFRVMHTMPFGELTFVYLAPAVDDSFRIELLAGPGAGDRPPYGDLHESLNLSGWHHLCFRIESIDETVAELKNRGVTLSPDHSMFRTSVEGSRSSPILGVIFSN